MLLCKVVFAYLTEEGTIYVALVIQETGKRVSSLLTAITQRLLASVHWHDCDVAVAAMDSPMLDWH
jgi:hypothetical protein